jgi:hypothetical protein
LTLLLKNLYFRSSGLCWNGMERKELEMGWQWDGRKKMRAPAEREYVSGAVAAEPKKRATLNGIV